MNRADLVKNIKSKNSFLCVGLDTDIDKIPAHLLKEADPIFAFNKEIVDCTQEYCVSYKMNLAFYESMGLKGMEALMKTINYLPSDQFVIADAKRGDIGNTANMYARAFFQEMNVDAVTLSPYMGKDSITPFLEYENKWAIVLGLTSNKGAEDFQTIESKDGKFLFESVLKKASSWGSDENLMFVVGATQEEAFAEVRKIIPNHFLLVPGVGAQGGDLMKLCQYGMNDDCGLLVNSSRAIIYAGNDAGFGISAGKAAKDIQVQMAHILNSRGII